MTDQNCPNHSRMRGVILAGGQGTRLLPATRITNKHLIPILERPMILYPLETLQTLGIKDILIVSGGNHIGAIADFLGDGSEYGVGLTYKVQKEAGGIAQALGLTEDFVHPETEKIAVILGDNIFDNRTLMRYRSVIANDPRANARIFLKEVPDPQRFGVLTPLANEKFMIEEKPLAPLSNFAVTGLYIYPVDVFEIIKTLKPSARGELEITDVNNHYIRAELCLHTQLDGFWSDAGTPESLYEVVRWAYANRDNQ